MVEENNSHHHYNKTNTSTREIQTEVDNSTEISLNISREIVSQNLDTTARPESSKNDDDNFLLRGSSPMSSTLSIIQRIKINQQLRISSNLPSNTSIMRPQPMTLFVQALAKLNERSLSSHNILFKYMKNYKTDAKSEEMSPPDSLTNAPPSYSFVLRQTAARRRPRLMGTFMSSPSFVQHTPPPNYTTAFDIYVDNPIPIPPQRTYNFGFTPMPIVCPECGFTGMTVISSRITLCTHLCALILCLLCCWMCAPLPYVLKSCKVVHHYCRNCRNYLGRYCPTNPDSGTQTCT